MSQLRIPVSLEILADMETPLSVFKKLGNKPFSYLFESVEGGEKWARYSLIGLPSSRVIKVYKNQIKIFNNGKIEEEITSSCLLYTSPSPRDVEESRMPSSA